MRAARCCRCYHHGIPHYQTIAGAACANVDYFELDYSVADKGSDSGNTYLRLKIYDGTTTTTAQVSLTSATVNTKAVLRVSTSALVASGTWTLTYGLFRTASSGPSSQTVPRVYVANMRRRWKPYKLSPLRVLRYSDNLARTATLSGTTPDTGFALANLAAQRQSKVYVSASGTSGYVEADLGSAQSVALVSLTGCQLLGSDTLTLTAGASTPPATLSVVMPVNAADKAHCQFTLASYRYWRITWSVASARKMVLGELQLGLTTHLQHHVAWDPELTHEFKTSKLVTPYGVEWAYAIGDQRAWALGFTGYEACDVDTFEAILDDCDGDVYPVLLLPEPTQYASYFGTFGPGVKRRLKNLRHESIGSVSFREQPLAVVQS